MTPSNPKPRFQQRGSSQNIVPSSATTAKDASRPPPAPHPINTNVARVGLDPAKLDAMSPGVRDVAEHAAQLKALLLHVGSIYDMVGRQASQMAEISPAVLGKDQVEIIKKDLASVQEQQERKLALLRKGIEFEKAKFLKIVNDKVSVMIKDFVASQVKKRVSEQIKIQVEAFSKQVNGNRGRMLRNQLMLNNIDAKNRNSTLRPNRLKEPISELTRPISVQLVSSPSSNGPPKPVVSPAITGVSISQHFPKDLQGLLSLDPTVAKALVKDYELEESDKKLEDGRLDNLNRLMSHFGIGYRLIPAGPKPILTSVWDR